MTVTCVTSLQRQFSKSHGKRNKAESESHLHTDTCPIGISFHTALVTLHHTTLHYCYTGAHHTTPHQCPIRYSTKSTLHHTPPHMPRHTTPHHTTSPYTTAILLYGGTPHQHPTRYSTKSILHLTKPPLNTILHATLYFTTTHHRSTAPHHTTLHSTTLHYTLQMKVLSPVSTLFS